MRSISGGGNVRDALYPVVAAASQARPFRSKFHTEVMMRIISNGTVVLGAVAWALLAGWHVNIIALCGWPTFLLGQMFMAGPAIALVGHALVFSLSRVRRSYWSLVLGGLSLLLAAGWIYLEISMRFIGYK